MIRGEVGKDVVEVEGPEENQPNTTGFKTSR